MSSVVYRYVVGSGGAWTDWRRPHDCRRRFMDQLGVPRKLFHHWRWPHESHQPTHVPLDGYIWRKWNLFLAVVAGTWSLSACTAGDDSDGNTNGGGVKSASPGSAAEPLPKPATFQQAPSLDGQDLPPVEERLPDNPYVIPHSWVQPGEVRRHHQHECLLLHRRGHGRPRPGVLLRPLPAALPERRQRRRPRSRGSLLGRPTTTPRSGRSASARA